MRNGNLVLSPNRVFSDFDRMFERFFPARTGDTDTVMELTPRVNIREDVDVVTLTFALPGVEKEGIKVEVNDRVLKISGERKFSKEENETGWIRREFHEGSFARSFTLPQSVDPAAVNAEYKNGILMLTLPKREESKPKQIAVAVR